MLLLSMAFLAVPVDSVVVRDIQVARGETLRTTISGRGQPIVLLPGIFGGAYGYRKITGPLVARGYQTIVVEPLGYGWSSNPKNADYSFTAQTGRVAGVLDSLGVTRALLVAQSSGASIAFRLAIQRPDLVRGLLSIGGGPAESAATPGMRKAFKLGGLGGFMTKLAVNESKLRHDVHREILRNSGDTTWVTPAVIRGYTAGRAADLDGSIDAFQRMSKSKEGTSLAARLHELKLPVRLLVGSVPHPAEVKREERALLQSRLTDFQAHAVKGSGQYIQEEQPAAVLAAVLRLAAAAP
jgi:pimeloyl-ACP methyl ester carboxylesterase